MATRVLVLVGLLATLGCGRAGGGPGGRTDGILEGTALASPQCPVQIQGRPCPPKPLSAEVTVADPDGRVVATFRTDADGRFSISLPAGSYVLTSSQALSPVLLTPVTVQVSAGRVTRVRLDFDTGIR